MQQCAIGFHQGHLPRDAVTLGWQDGAGLDPRCPSRGCCVLTNTGFAGLFAPEQWESWDFTKGFCF